MRSANAKHEPATLFLSIYPTVYTLYPHLKGMFREVLFVWTWNWKEAKMPINSRIHQSIVVFPACWNTTQHWKWITTYYNKKRGFPGGSDGKESACSAGDLGSTPELGRSPGEGNGNPLQYSCLENSMDWGAWWATVPGVAKSQTQLSDFTFTFTWKKMGWSSEIKGENQDTEKYLILTRTTNQCGQQWEEWPKFWLEGRIREYRSSPSVSCTTWYNTWIGELYKNTLSWHSWCVCYSLYTDDMFGTFK